MKKIFLILIISLLTSCGYEPLYINKGDFLKNIGNIEKVGNEIVNRRIITLIGIKADSASSQPHTLKLDSNKDKVIATKDISGNVKAYKISIKIKVSIINNNENSKILKSKEFNSTFIYNIQEDKFQMSQDIRNIENNLIESVSEKIIIYLNS